MRLSHRQQAYNVSYCFLAMNVDAIETLHAFRKADIANIKGYIQYRIADRVPGALVNTLKEKNVVDALRAHNMRNHPQSQWRKDSPYRVLIGGVLV